MAKDIIDVLKEVGAIITDSHFVYTSGRHGSVYINKDIIYPHTKITSEIGEMFAEKFKDEDIDVVAAPAVGGVILSQWTAYHLSNLKNKEILSVYTEKDKGTLASAAESEHIFRRGYDKLVKGKKVLVLEDLTNTGISLRKVIEAVKLNGGEVAAACVMVNRNPDAVSSESLGIPFSALGVFHAEAVAAKDCQLCKNNVPINTSVGHGKKFLAEKKTK
ncbi:phosphoribosyltransferase [Candidatus Daviesbacteria bacterium]|nr:phosphoribosyltransferase [Candidatus Daviesbacteria bacterium]